MDQENELSLGEYLKRSREQANFSIEKLSLKTRINGNILKSLEADDFKNLPNPAYLKGFVLSYVKMFSLDEATAIKKLESSYQEKTGIPYPSLSSTKTATPALKKTNKDTDELLNKSESIIDTTKSFMPFIIGAIIIAASFGGYKVVSNMINQEAKSHKESDIVEGEDTVDIQEDVEQITDSPDEASIQPESEPGPEPEKVEEAPVVTPPKPKPEPEKKVETKTSKGNKRNFPTVEFKSIPTKLYTLKPDAPENKDDSLMPRSYKAKLDPEQQNIYIHALNGETWVSYKVDDEPIQNEFIREGKALFLQGKVIRMFFGNINVTKIFLNNTFIDAPSSSGVKTIVFPQSAASNFQRPLFPRSANGVLYTSEEYMEKMKNEEQKIGNP